MVEWQQAPDIQKKINHLIKKLGFDHIVTRRVFCFRGFGSKSKAHARIWSLSRIWQKALRISPSYVIEVISEKFDKLSREKQTEVLIHELLHIPKTFSGALRPHRMRYFKLNQKAIKKLLKKYHSP